MKRYNPLAKVLNPPHPETDDGFLTITVSRRAAFAGLGLLAGSALAGFPVPALAVGRPDSITMGTVSPYPDYTNMYDTIAGKRVYSHQMTANGGLHLYCCDPTLGTPWVGQVFSGPYGGGKVLDYLCYYGYGGPGYPGGIYGQTDANDCEAITQFAIWYALGQISSTGVTHTRKWAQAGKDTAAWAQNQVNADPDGPYVGCAFIYDPAPGAGTQRVIGISVQGDCKVQKHSNNAEISNQLGLSFTGITFKLYEGGSWPNEQKDQHYTGRSCVLAADGTGTIEGLEPGSYWLQESSVGNSGYALNDHWYGLTVSAGQTTVIDAYDDPMCKVRFWVVDLGGNAAQVYICDAAYGSTFDTSNSNVTNADNEVKRVHPETALDVVRRWYFDKDLKQQFSSTKIEKAYTDLYARLPPTLTFVVIDGEGNQTTVHEEQVAWGTDLTTSHSSFGSADGEVSERWPDVPIDEVTRWYKDTELTERFERETLKGNLTLYARLPATVHFLYKEDTEDDQTFTEVYTYKVRSGTTVSSTDSGFADGDAALKEHLGVETLEYVKRWLKDRDRDSEKFTSQRVLTDLYVYAFPQWGTVVYYVDGTTADDVVVLPDGSKAIYPHIPLGTRVTVRDDVTQAARRPNCTPGLTAWYTDPEDPAVADEELPAGVEALGPTRASLASRALAAFRRATRRVAPGASKFTSGVLDKPLLELYGVNRATVSFDYTEDSTIPRADVTYRQAPKDDAPAADVSLPSPKVARVDRATTLPTRGTAFEPQDGGRWRTLSPEAWWRDGAGTDGTISMVELEHDTTVYVRWRYRTTDGVVDHRQ